MFLPRNLTSLFTNVTSRTAIHKSHSRRSSFKDPRHQARRIHSAYYPATLTRNVDHECHVDPAGSLVSERRCIGRVGRSKEINPARRCVRWNRADTPEFKGSSLVTVSTLSRIK